MKSWPQQNRWALYNSGSWLIPYRVDATGRPTFDHRRVLLDWDDDYAPRRLYYFGKHMVVTMALDRGGKSQSWNWRRHRFTNRWRWLTVHPTNYRDRFTG